MKRFWDKVNRSGACWLWTAGTNGRYGTFRLSNPRRHEYAHRMAYILENGPIPNGLEVRHTCDTPLCCNPEHLKLGTHADNMRDMADRNRGRSGSQKLTIEQVDEILRRVAAGERQSHLSVEFNISRARICQLWGQVK